MVGYLGVKTRQTNISRMEFETGFGMDFDPVTGNLWDTENGPQDGDEINLVGGFNSGWNKVQGFWEPKGQAPGKITYSPKELFSHNDTSMYRTPELGLVSATPGLNGYKIFEF